MDAWSILQQAAGRTLIDEEGQSEVVRLQPPASAQRLLEIEQALGFALPAELRDLLSRSAGLDFDVSDSIDLASIGPCPVEGLFGSSMTITGDGAGNHWMLELRANMRELGPVWFLCHDAPVLVYQSATLAAFLADYLSYMERFEAGPIARVVREAVRNVWVQEDDIPRDVAAGSSDPVLRAFAARLEQGWFVRDLRQARTGEGMAIGRFGPSTPLARAGAEFVFAYGSRTRFQRLKTFLTGR